MKLALAFLTLGGLTLFAQAPAAAPKPATAAKSALDKATLEAYLRNAELWVPQVTVTIDNPVASKYLPGFNEVVVHLAFNGQGKDEKYYVSTDGQSIIKGEAYNIAQSPFQANLDKLKTDLQPSYGDAGAPVVI